MPRLALNKSSLSREKARLETYRAVLPALDLKRRQLLAERGKSARTLQDLEERLEEIERWVGEELPMLANGGVNLAGLVTVRRVEWARQNLVGVSVPYVRAVELDRLPYSFLAKPHWVDAVSAKLGEYLELWIRRECEVRRLECLERAVRKVTQRFNLFDKVLIPDARRNIDRIRVFLSDLERAAVVRAKIAKRKRQDVGST
ncbi:MAG TPA: V-type ATP synthase subunit D [Methylococcus sp.]|nr:V-type ATP synthase subunit D [Methylococcus sp.]